jgi:hypothetical protein
MKKKMVFVLVLVFVSIGAFGQILSREVLQCVDFRMFNAKTGMWYDYTPLIKEAGGYTYSDQLQILLYYYDGSTFGIYLESPRSVQGEMHYDSVTVQNDLGISSEYWASAIKVASNQLRINIYTKSHNRLDWIVQLRDR